MAQTVARPSPVRPTEQVEAGSRLVTIVAGGAAFTGGAVLLGVELAASRVLAPFFGNSLFVWGALIGVVLSGLALGYWLGGVAADRRPAADVLVAALVLGGLAVLAIPLVDESVLELVVSWDPGPRLDPLVAATILFGPVSVLLASITPIAVRLATHSVGTVGRTAGRLFAISTAGSIAGTFATAFFLIPELGTEQLLAFSAAVLLGAAVVVALAIRLPLLVPVPLVGALGALAIGLAVAPESGQRLSGAASQNWSPVYRIRSETQADRAGEAAIPERGLTIRFAKDTQYHRLAVLDDARSRYLRFDNSLQSAMIIKRPFATRFRYTDFFHLGLAYNPDARNVLFIGLGAGSSPKRMWREFPRLQLTAVELDPVVVDVAHRFFALPRHPRLRIEVEDGRRYLAKNAGRWDVIAIDAFFADAIPFHLVTREFLELARSRLAPGGVIVTNAIGALQGQSSKLFRSMYRTYRSTFPTVTVHPTILPGEEDHSITRNLMLVATEGAAPAKGVLDARWDAVRRRVPTAPDLEKPIRERYEARIPFADVPLLTDDYAPTDALLLVQ